tara:strand:+ start:251 stop:1309 length:1059 start_codon:yes stop_codon:yes gene_type:complete
MVKHTFITVISTFIIYGGCWAQTFEDLEFGTEETLDVITWNIEWFPKNGVTTTGYVKEIIEGLAADIYAIQEIDDTTAFKTMVSLMEDYEYVLMDGWFGGLVYVYNSQNIEMLEAYKIYTESQYWSPLPRSPLVMKFKFMGEEVYIINNHYKCCGDDYVNWNDDGDEEMRRIIASTLIEEYMSEVLEGERVILLGDLNDLIDEVASTNVFGVFLEEPLKYRFADLDLATGGVSGWSYPSWPSHLDHILVTDEMFEELEGENTVVEAIDIASHMGGWYQYEANISDHKPVGMRVELLPSLTVEVMNEVGRKTLVGMTDVLGRECQYEPGKVMIFRYSDGSVSRRISLSESQPE